MYHVSCADCQATYISETERRQRPLGTRLKEHQKRSSPIGEHMGGLGAHNHSFAPEAVIVQCKEKDWLQCGIEEAIWIAKENPSLNLESGTLSPRSTTNFCHHMTLASHRVHMTTRHGRRPEVLGLKLLTFCL